MKCKKCKTVNPPQAMHCFGCEKYIDNTEEKMITLALSTTLLIPFFAMGSGVADLDVSEVIIPCAITMLVAFVVMAINEKQQRLTRFESEQKRRQFFDKHEIPSNCNQVIYFSGCPGLPRGEFMYLWIQKGYLNMLPIAEHAIRHQIPMVDIINFTLKGDLFQETEIVGHNTSVVGDRIVKESLSTANAMRVGQKISKIKNVDERKTIINARMDGENKFILFEKADVYNYLLENIPEKENSFVAMNK